LFGYEKLPEICSSFPIACLAILHSPYPSNNRKDRQENTRDIQTKPFPMEQTTSLKYLMKSFQVSPAVMAYLELKSQDQRLDSQIREEQNPKYLTRCITYKV
jgi:hypothetical protein